jgi:hypothetical protein
MRRLIELGQSQRRRTKCLATALTVSRRPASSHCLALSAFVIVSSVVNVFEETMPSVFGGIPRGARRATCRSRR